MRKIDYYIELDHSDSIWWQTNSVKLLHYSFLGGLLHSLFLYVLQGFQVHFVDFLIPEIISFIYRIICNHFTLWFYTMIKFCNLIMELRQRNKTLSFLKLRKFNLIYTYAVYIRQQCQSIMLFLFSFSKRLLMPPLVRPVTPFAIGFLFENYPHSYLIWLWITS